MRGWVSIGVGRKGGLGESLGVCGQGEGKDCFGILNFLYSLS